MDTARNEVRATTPVLFGTLAAGCVSIAPSPIVFDRQLDLGASPAVYDQKTGLCRDGYKQILSKQQVDELLIGWRDPPGALVCTSSDIRRVPDEAAIPKSQRENGAALVMVRLDIDGRVAAVNTVCATSDAIAKAGVAVVGTMTFAPRICDEVPVRSAGFIPYAYHMPQ